MDTLDLFGKRTLGVVFTHDYYAWGEQQLNHMRQSDALQALADEWAVQQMSADEIEHVFQQALLDLGLREPDQRHALYAYAERLCEQILDHTLIPKAGLSLLEDFVPLRQRYPLFSIWLYLCLDVWRPYSPEQERFNTGITLENDAEYIRNVSRQFITLLHTDLAADFFAQRICADCHKTYLPIIAEAAPAPIESTQTSEPAQCPHCASHHTYSMNDYVGRKIYLEHRS